MIVTLGGLISSLTSYQRISDFDTAKALTLIKLSLSRLKSVYLNQLFNPTNG